MVNPNSPEVVVCLFVLPIPLLDPSFSAVPYETEKTIKPNKFTFLARICVTYLASPGMFLFLATIHLQPHANGEVLV